MSGSVRERCAALRHRPVDSKWPVTRRELEVLRLAANGNTTAAMARWLGITPDAVNTRLRSVYRKLGARDRTHAVALAMARGLIRPEEITDLKAEA